MAESSQSRSPQDELPEAVMAPRRRRRPQLVWIIPIVAALAGAWVAVTSILERGPTATISFATAEGMEAGKTKIKYKDVDIGEITKIVVSDDDSHVICTAQFTKEATKYLVKDTRFWVVRPRLGAGGVSGLSTLFSGSYIGIDAGKSREARGAFTGLDLPPIVTANMAGREYVLHAADIGSIDVGEALYFRRVQVGQVISYELDPDGKGVTLRVFVNAPYDKYVTTATVFWHASGVDVTLDAEGIRVQTESLASILTGGIAFQSAPDVPDETPAPAGSRFTLAADRMEALKRPDQQVRNFVLYFRETTRGLSAGAPVDFNGIVIGQVKSIGIEYDPAAKLLRFPVSIDVYPDRLRARYRKGGVTVESVRGAAESLLDNLVEHGYRAQLRTGNLITGQLYVAFDRFPNAPKARVDHSRTPAEIPTTPGTLHELQESLTQIANKLERLPLEQIAGDVRQTLQTLNRMLDSADALVKKVDAQLVPEVNAVLVDTRRAVGNAGQTFEPDSPGLAQARETMRELARAAEAVRLLAETLERNPESLVRGKKGDAP